MKQREYFFFQVPRFHIKPFLFFINLSNNVKVFILLRDNNFLANCMIIHFFSLPILALIISRTLASIYYYAISIILIERIKRKYDIYRFASEKKESELLYNFNNVYSTYKKRENYMLQIGNLKAYICFLILNFSHLLSLNIIC